MRSEREMLDLILGVAEEDTRIRAVILRGSRANPRARRDPFQDFDIVYLVTEVAPFRGDREWIQRFGEIMILQTPDEMGDPSPGEQVGYAYLMQFTDGNRIDLSIYPLERWLATRRDSLSWLLLDKDGAVGPLPPASEHDYLPSPPSRKQFADCCNEFWWVCPYVAKGLWREQLTYARHMLDQAARDELMKMLSWHVGVQTDFSRNLGGLGKHMQEHLDPAHWQLLTKTYAGGSCEETWNALFAMCELFRRLGVTTAEHFGYEYPEGEDKMVSAHLTRVRSLPNDAETLY
jgi:aminoglycoside 6-adenylyltransferase